MQFAQILVSDDQALQTRLALDLVLDDPERFVMADEEREAYTKLAALFGSVAAEPSKFAPTGAMARTVKMIVRKAKGPAQTPPRLNKRKARQELRQTTAKRRRQNRKVAVAEFNVTREQQEEWSKNALREHEELIARFEAEPKFDLLDASGNAVMTDIPESLLRPKVVESEADSLILPAGVRA